MVGDPLSCDGISPMGWEPDGGGREGREGTGFDSGSDRDRFRTFFGFSSEKWFSENCRKNANLEEIGRNSTSTKTENLRLKSFILTRRGGAI